MKVTIALLVAGAAAQYPRHVDPISRGDGSDDHCAPCVQRGFNYCIQQDIGAYPYFYNPIDSDPDWVDIYDFNH